MGLLTRIYDGRNNLRAKTNRNFIKGLREDGLTYKDFREDLKSDMEEISGKTFEEILEGSLADYKKYFENSSVLSNIQSAERRGLNHKVYTEKSLSKITLDNGEIDFKKLEDMDLEFHEQFLDEAIPYLESEIYFDYLGKTSEEEELIPENVEIEDYTFLTKYFSHSHKLTYIKEINTMIIHIDFSIYLDQDPKMYYLRRHDSFWYDPKYFVSDKELVEKTEQKASEILTRNGYNVWTTEIRHKLIKENRKDQFRYSELYKSINIGSKAYIKESIDKVSDRNLQDKLKKMTFTPNIRVYNPVNKTTSSWVEEENITYQDKVEILTRFTMHTGEIIEIK